MAWKKHELYELFSADDKYVYDANGKYTIAQDPTLMRTTIDKVEPVDHVGVVNALETVYYDLPANRRDDFKNDIVHALGEMIRSKTTKNLFYATLYYCEFASRTLQYTCVFEDIDEVMKNPLEEALIECKSQLVKTKKYGWAVYKNGAWQRLQFYNRDIPSDKKLKALLN